MNHAQMQTPPQKEKTEEQLRLEYEISKQALRIADKQQAMYMQGFKFALAKVKECARKYYTDDEWREKMTDEQIINEACDDAEDVLKPI